MFWMKPAISDLFSKTSLKSRVHYLKKKYEVEAGQRRKEANASPTFKAK